MNNLDFRYTTEIFFPENIFQKASNQEGAYMEMSRPRRDLSQIADNSEVILATINSVYDFYLILKTDFESMRRLYSILHSTKDLLKYEQESNSITPYLFDVKLKRKQV
jgi:ribosomal protein S15P/S13E